MMARGASLFGLLKPGDARIVRSLVAMVLAVVLIGLVVMKERSSDRASIEAMYSVHATLWTMNELIHESQRMSRDLSDYAAGLVPHDAVQERYAILLESVGSIGATPIGQWPAMQRHLETFALFLEQERPLLFERRIVPLAQLQRIKGRLDTMAEEARQTYSDIFANDMGAVATLGGSQSASGTFAYRFTVIGLVVLLMAYILTEIYGASRAQQKAAELREMASQASAAKSRFLANVSHEIRTPLNGILGMASELSETDMSDDQMRCVQVIEQSGGLLLSTINDVLDFSKVEEGIVHIERRPFRLDDVIEAASQLYSAKARQKGLTLTVERHPDLPKDVDGDERRLRQVLNNLIANAVKFTEDGSVTVTAAPGSAADTVVFRVSDTGPGVADDKRDLIFQPFTQADASVTRTYGGTGLGLAISRQLSEAMGGTLTLEDGAGTGASFRCEVPLPAIRRVEAARTRVARDDAPDLTGWTILVADDNATNRLILSRFLKPTGASVSIAVNGEEAVDLATAQRFDIILMDIQMPRMDGMVATRQIRSSEAENGLPPVRITAVTANVLDAQIEDYLEAGLDDVLPKPVSKAGLFAALAALAATRVAA